MVNLDSGVAVVLRFSVHTVAILQIVKPIKRKMKKNGALMKRCGMSVVTALLLSANSMAQDASITAKPSFFPKLFGLNKNVSVGIIGGTMEHFDYGAIGFNVTAYGVYADFMGWPKRSLKSAHKLVETLLKNEAIRLSTWACHVGYQIPFHQYLDGSISLIPMVGYYSAKECMFLDYDLVSYTSGNIDYGAAIAFQRRDKTVGSYKFYIAYTRYTAWVGLGIEFPFRK